MAAIILNEFIVRPYLRVARMIAIGFSISLAFITLTLCGYRGRTRPAAPVPEVITDHSEYAVALLIVICIASFVAFFWLFSYNDLRKDWWINIEGSTLKTFGTGTQITIDLRSVSRLSFQIMPWFNKLYNDEFHRIGRLSITDTNATYVFYFPVRNEEVSGRLSALANAISG